MSLLCRQLMPIWRHASAACPLEFSGVILLYCTMVYPVVWSAVCLYVSICGLHVSDFRANIERDGSCDQTCSLHPVCIAAGYIGHKRCAARCRPYLAGTPCKEDHLTKTCSGFCGCAEYKCKGCNCTEAPVCQGSAGRLKLLSCRVVLLIS